VHSLPHPVWHVVPQVAEQLFPHVLSEHPVAHVPPQVAEQAPEQEPTQIVPQLIVTVYPPRQDELHPFLHLNPEQLPAHVPVQFPVHTLEQALPHVPPAHNAEQAVLHAAPQVA